MSQRQQTNRRFFCELCKVTLPYTKLDINDHNRSSRHVKNKEKDLDYKHNKAKMAKMTNQEKYEYH